MPNGFGLHAKKAVEATQQQAATLSKMKPREPKKTLGAGLMQSATGAIAAAPLGLGLPGVVAGGITGLASYYLS